jgi:signal transduction histidine kinase
MSAAIAAGRARWGDPAWRSTALAGTVLVAALVLALAAGGVTPRVVAVALAAGVLPALAALLGPGAVRSLRRSDGRALVAAGALVGLPLLLLPFLWWSSSNGRYGPASQLGRLPDGPQAMALAVACLSALSGLALIGDDLRRRARGAGRRANRSPWQQMTTTERVRSLPWRVVIGALLVGWSALLILIVAGPLLAGSGLMRMMLVLFVVVGALVVVALPVLVGVAASRDRQRLAETREDERQRVAAHLHDSVLQTLSLVQRQAGDPVAVARLARQQERSLRAWMAGQPEARLDTLAGALQAAVEQVEAEESVEVQVTVIGDRPLDGPGEAIVAAAREALRNTARHARASAVVVFAELTAGGGAVYVRDEGQGFDLAEVPLERRGVRDAIVGRMAAVGGQATIDSVPGEGTEVSLRLPANGDGGSR